MQTALSYSLCFPLSKGVDILVGLGRSLGGGVVSVGSSQWYGCYSVFMHAANVGHARNYSGNLSRQLLPTREFALKIQTPQALDSSSELVIKWIDNHGIKS